MTVKTIRVAMYWPECSLQMECLIMMRSKLTFRIVKATKANTTVNSSTK